MKTLRLNAEKSHYVGILVKIKTSMIIEGSNKKKNTKTLQRLWGLY